MDILMSKTKIPRMMSKTITTKMMMLDSMVMSEASKMFETSILVMISETMIMIMSER